MERTSLTGPHSLTPVAPRPPDSPGSGYLLTPEVMGKRLSVSRSMVYKLIRTGEVKAVYVGRLPRIAENELAAYIDRQGTER